MDDMLIKYADKFKENFPIYSIPAEWNEEDIIRCIGECIDKDEIYEFKYDEKKDY